jgi:hypothetical protein
MHKSIVLILALLAPATALAAQAKDAPGIGLSLSGTAPGGRFQLAYADEALSKGLEIPRSDLQDGDDEVQEAQALDLKLPEE